MQPLPNTPSFEDVIDMLAIVVTLLFVIVLVQALAIWALSRQVGILFERVSPLGALVSDAGPAVGAQAPQFQQRCTSGALPNLDRLVIAQRAMTNLSRLGN